MSAGIEADDATLVAIDQSPKRRTMKVKTNIKAGMRKAGGDPATAGKPF